VAVGPLFYYELVRLARKGRGIILRCGYALAVFAALYVVYQNRFPSYDLLIAPFAAPWGSTNDLARLAEDFVLAVLWVQSVAIFVLGPAYIAGAFVEDRNQGTLDLLFTTHLTDREIVLGKLAARSVHLGGILLAGLPLLVVTQLWGGVDVRLLLAAWLATGLNVVNVAAVSARGSVVCRTVMGAVTFSYLSVLRFFLFSGIILASVPVTLFLAMLRMPGSASPRSIWMPTVFEGGGLALPLLACITTNCLWIVLSIYCAVRDLRPVIKSPGPEVAAGKKSPQPQQPRSGWLRSWLDDGRARQLASTHPLPPIGSRPLLWKETYPGSGRMTWWIESRILANWRPLQFLLPLIVLPLLAVRWQGDTERYLNLDFVRNCGRILVLLPAAAWCAVLAIRAADGIGREREAGALDTLLTLPVSVTELLGSKWSGAVLHGRGLGYVLAALAGMELVIGSLHPTGAVLLAVAVAAHGAFFASLGIWLSLVCRTAVAARTSVAAVLLACLLGAFQFAQTSHFAGALSRPLPQWIRAADVTNPLGTWWYFVSFPDDLAAREGLSVPDLVVAAGGVLAFAGLAGVLWLDALRRFRRYRVS
jgi:ABC-type transport system involved in multi-copper enzyme maturation permease subunit